MNWVKENKALAGILGVMIAGALGLGAWLYLSYADYSASMEQWSANDNTLSSLQSKKVYPDKKNADARVADVEAYGAKVDQLWFGLLSPQSQQPIKPMSQTEFQAKLKERATVVVQMAKSADITLPADFALGFSEYTNSAPRSAEVAAELGVQLDVLEHLITVILKENVKSVDLFDRTKLPNEVAAPAPKPEPVKPKKPRPGSAAANKNKRQALTEEQAQEPVLDRYPVKVSFTTDQRPFERIMNALCNPRSEGGQTPHFLVVRLLRVENERQDGPSKEEVARKKTPAVGLEGVDPSAPPAANAPKVQPDAITIMGEEKLKVYLEVDYIRFRPNPATAAEDAAASPETASAPKP